MANTVMDQFMKELSKHDLLTAEQEVEKFTRLGAIKNEVIRVVDQSAVLYHKIPGLIFLLSDGYEAVKTIVEPHKFDENTKQLTGKIVKLLQAYQLEYQRKLIEQDTNTAVLNQLSTDMNLSVAFIDTLLDDVLSYEGTDPLVDMHCTKDKFEEIQYKLSALKKERSNTRDEIVNANLRLVVKIARGYVRNNEHHHLLDLIQEGTLGLMNATERFDVTTGNKFSTMATFWVKQAITRSLQNDSRTIRIPVNVQEHMSKVLKITTSLTQKLMRVPTNAELAAEMGITLERFNELQQAFTEITSIDTPVGEEGEGMTLQDVIADAAESADVEIYSDQIKTAIREALDSLPERERTVVELRYGFSDDPKSLSEVGLVIGTGKQTVQNIENRALLKLHRYLCVTLGQ